MPPVSERQRRAMWAAKEGHSTLGIPKSVGEEFVGKDATIGPEGLAAGIVFVAPDGDVLLLRRSADEKNYGGHWGIPGGKGDDKETPEQAARREAMEEMGRVPAGPMKALNRRKTPNGFVFHTFAQAVDQKFVPQLDGEHSGYAWASLDMLPQPLHPSVAEDLGPHLGAAEDMTPDDWNELRSTFAKWTREEETETEHQGEDASRASFSKKVEEEVRKGHPLKQAVAIAYHTVGGEDAKAFDCKSDNLAALICHRVTAGATPALAMDWALKLDHVSNSPEIGRIAFDRESVRRKDDNGNLHVSKANISVAAVNEYTGQEINEVMKDEPGWKMLDPDKLYRLYRDPESLKKAADSFNNLPVLSEHKAISADKDLPELVVGSTGTDATFEDPYLTNSLVLWKQDAIDDVENEQKRELSSSYRYKADMKPGTVNGEDFDGIMYVQSGNHVAIVPAGRAGPDVAIGDSADELAWAKIETALMAI